MKCVYENSYVERLSTRVFLRSNLFVINKKHRPHVILVIIGHHASQAKYDKANELSNEAIRLWENVANQATPDQTTNKLHLAAMYDVHAELFEKQVWKLYNRMSLTSDGIVSCRRGSSHLIALASYDSSSVTNIVRDQEVSREYIKTAIIEWDTTCRFL